MRAKILILGLIFLFLIACKKGIENAVDEFIENNNIDGKGRID